MIYVRRLLDLAYNNLFSAHRDPLFMLPQRFFCNLFLETNAGDSKIS